MAHRDRDGCSAQSTAAFPRANYIRICFAGRGDGSERAGCGGWSTRAPDRIAREGESDRLEPWARSCVHDATAGGRGEISHLTGGGGNSDLCPATSRPRHFCGLRAVEADDGGVRRRDWILNLPILSARGRRKGWEGCVSAIRLKADSKKFAVALFIWHWRGLHAAAVRAFEHGVRDDCVLDRRWIRSHLHGPGKVDLARGVIRVSP